MPPLSCRKSLCNILIVIKTVVIIAELFSSCHIYVDPTPYVSMCEHDICHCVYKRRDDSSKCKCTVLSAYARACAHTGHPLNIDRSWRIDADCKVPCEGGREWQECGDAACEETCKMISYNLVGTCTAVSNCALTGACGVTLPVWCEKF